MRILITGATGGIGRAAALLALSQGHDVVAHGRNAAALAELAEAGAAVVPGDLRSATDLDALAHFLETAPLDAVIASQGISGGGAITDLSKERVRDVMEVNFDSVPRLFFALRSQLKKTGGRYVVIASQASLRPERFDSVYCASKWAALAWSEAQAVNERGSGIKIRALCPGRTVTALFDEAMAEFADAAGQPLDTYTSDILELIPLRRFASAEETAGSALFLAAAGHRPTVLAQTGGEVPY